MDLNCDIVCDLLPIYAEGLTRETTRLAVERHLKKCPNCRAAYAAIGWKEEPTEEYNIDFLKKQRKKGKQQLLTSTAVVSIIFAVILVEVLLHLMPLGAGAGIRPGDYISYPVTEVNISDFTPAGNDYFVFFDTDTPLLGINVIVESPGNWTEQEMQGHIRAETKGLIFRQTGCSANVIGNIIYIHITGYRQTVFYSGKPEQYCLAIAIAGE